MNPASVRMHMPAGSVGGTSSSTSPLSSNEAQVAPVASPTLCQGGGSIKLGVRSLMLLLATAASGAPFHDAVKGLRESGLNKIIIGEKHTLPGRYGLIADTLEAVNAGRVNLYREESEAPAELIEQAWTDKNRRGLILAGLLDTPWLGVITKAEKQAFAAAAMRQDVSLRIMMWQSDRKDTTRFIEDETFAIASVGAAHALFEPIAFDPERVVLMAPFLGDFSVGTDLETSRNVVPVTKGLLPLTWEEQDECFNAFERAQSFAPTMFVTTSNVWTGLAEMKMSVEPDGEVPGPSGLRDRFITYYTSQNFAIMEMPLPSSKELNATMIVPASFLPQLEVFAAKYPHTVNLFAPKPSAAPPVHGDL